MQDCIFCKIIKGEIPSTKVYEDKHTLAFLDIYPVNKGHTLVIPKEHASQLHELSEPAVKQLGVTLRKLAHALSKISEGYTAIQNNGDVAGQEVMHVHFHLIPRKKGDGAFYWPAKKSYEGAEAQDVAELIKKAMVK